MTKKCHKQKICHEYLACFCRRLNICLQSGRNIWQYVLTGLDMYSPFQNKRDVYFVIS